jgi:phosphatidylglycerol:prolipoprotein diacylglycerol transferase
MPALARVGGAAGTTSALEFVTFPLAAVAELRPHALGITYWFDPPTTEGAHEVVLRLTGRRLDVEGAHTPADDFVAVASLPDVRPGSGRTSLTHRVLGKAPGRWHVTAEAMAVPKGGGRSDAVRLPPAEAVGSSTFAPVAGLRAPGVVVGAWPAMVGLGVVLALALQSALAPKHWLPPGSVLALALAASVLGAVGAKLYYRLTHIKESGGHSFAGLSLQGFVIVATASFVIGGALQGMAVGHLLDATVPALLVGQAVGRLGCLLGGCCAGVPTLSRWAVWSSDRRVGTRRVPVQLMEAGAAAILALVTGAIAWQAPTSSAGLLFVAGLAAYVIVRQLLFPLRGLPRATRHGRQVTLVTALLTLLGSLAALFFM